MKNKSATNIRSIATMATLPTYDELVLMLRTLALFHPDLPVFILTQPIVQKRLQKETGLPPNRTVVIGLEKYHNKNWRQLEQAETIEFLSQKTTIIDQALRSYPNTLYTDCDMVFTAPIGFIDDSKDLGVSLHRPEYISTSGKYNAGWIFVRNKQFASWWRNEIAKSSSPFFVDQISLNGLAESFQTFHFPRNYNFRARTRFLFREVNPRKEVHLLLQINSCPEKGITYKGKPIISIHSHFHPIIKRNYPIFNAFIMLHLYKGLPEVFELINSNPHNRYRLSGDYLVKSRVDFFVFQLRRVVRVTMMRRISSFCPDYTVHLSTKRLLFKLIQETAVLICYPYYLIREGNYLYHASWRLGNEQFTGRELLTSILKLSFAKLIFWQDPKRKFARKALSANRLIKAD